MLQGFGVRLAGQLQQHIAQVFVGSGITGIGANRHFQGDAGFVQITLSGVQHRQVVVGLGQLRVVLVELTKNRHGFGALTHVVMNDPFNEAHLRVAGLAGQVRIGFGQCFTEFARGHQAVDVAVVVRMSPCRDGSDHQRRTQTQ